MTTKQKKFTYKTITWFRDEILMSQNTFDVFKVFLPTATPDESLIRLYGYGWLPIKILSKKEMEYFGVDIVICKKDPK